MYDMHYDLLTILYMNNTNNKFANKNKLIEDLKKMYNNNIIGGIINLYFMNEKEMLDELDITKKELNVNEMFRKSIQILNNYKDKNIIPKNIDYIYGIEGCDYIENIEDLDYLYKLGLRSIIPVWNNKNKYGSGFKSDIGLTKEGINLIKKAIDLGIIIDVSHANEKTFDDILNIVSEERKYKKIYLIASHSNLKTLCNRERNLTDKQILKLKQTDGYIGLFTNSNFTSLNRNLSYKQRRTNFINHLKYLIEILKFDYKKIIISTDDMNFSPDINYHNLETYKLENIYSLIRKDIENNFSKEIADAVLVENSKNLIKQINKQ